MRAMEMEIEPVFKLATKIERNKLKLGTQGKEEVGIDRKPKVIANKMDICKMKLYMWMEKYSHFKKD